MKPTALHVLDERRLLQLFENLVRKDRAVTAKMLGVIAEIDRRKLWAKHAYPSMFAFCVGRFRMSESQASKRIWAARTARKFPIIFEMIDQGELHLSGVVQLAKHLNEGNHRDVLARARHKTLREIEGLIAEVAPRPDIPSRVVKLPIRRNAAKNQVVPLAPGRYKMQVTISEETHDKLRELQELLSHQVPDGDPAKLVDRAFDALLDKARRRKVAKTDKPRNRSRATTKRTRAVPASTRRQVFARDGGQCVFVDETGNRCAARRFIEFHHRQPHGDGGSAEADNIELRCSAHNQYQADLDYGRAFMDGRRNRGGRLAPE